MEPVPVLLAMTYRALGDQFHDRLRQIGLEPLRPAHGYVFRFLEEKRATTVDIGQHLGVTKQAAAKIANELDEWGYVLKEPHPTDKRAQYVTLTTKGRDYLKLADNLWSDLEAEMAEAIGADTLATVKQGLAAYLRHVRGEDRPGLRPIW
ncbi:MarR family winged helix-turn-helix transcriptional regulator [Lentzea jiangxiensis]|uniref:DNA-binding transcriptional regulator, MarR family n=1 Tax=Lentzea jiangxiensis TaxID=641025 RepID=A0A1H0VDC3_9PSEU|nr:MarR family transcriptional regulator [Lentzea jiangxiensis]SDP76344.1 DNA-binding transcriptional regulator, MarR family [Lentzea jiangxiensis]